MSQVDFNKYHCDVIRSNLKLLDCRLVYLIGAKKTHTREYYDVVLDRKYNIKCLRELEAEHKEAKA